VELFEVVFRLIYTEACEEQFKIRNLTKPCRNYIFRQIYGKIADTDDGIWFGNGQAYCASWVIGLKAIEPLYIFAYLRRQ
jgi:hypothetical protein